MHRIWILTVVHQERMDGTMRTGLGAATRESLVTAIYECDCRTATFSAVNYYASVSEKMGGLNKTKNFYRLFILPGMMHWGSGNGPNLVGNMLDFAFLPSLTS
jgi:hypothetical protein